MRTIALLVAVVAFSANADIFKWIDERGETQYGDSPPRGVKATRVAITPPGDKATQDKRVQPERASDGEKRKTEGEKVRASRCTFYTEQLALIEGQAAVNEKGETVIPDARRDEAKERLRKLAKENCS